MRMIRASLLAASAASAFVASAAYAEDTQPAASAATQPADAATAQPAAAAAQPAPATTVAEDQAIVVTARRTAERLTSVPVSVTVVSGDSLASRGVQRVDDLAMTVPSLATRPTAGRRNNSQYEIRGINVVESLITEDPAVGIYVNEVYRPRATGTNQSLYDIENVQVLYGPQGTLFGRNTSAGAVLITTHRPTHDLEGSIEGTYGNYNYYQLTGVLNVPLGDTLAIRLAGQRSSRDGFGTNVTTGDRLGNINSWSGRASILWQPADGIENETVASIYRADEAGAVVVLSGFRPCPSATAASPAAPCSNGRAFLGAATTPTLRTYLANFFTNVVPTLGKYQTALDNCVLDFRGNEAPVAPTPLTTPAACSRDPFEVAHVWNVSNTTTIRLGGNLTLRNIFGYQHLDSIDGTDLDGTPIDGVDTYLHSTNSALSDEVQLQGTGSHFHWVVGAMYFRERGRDIQYSIQLVTSLSRQNLLGINTSYAAYAQATWEFLPHFSLTAGGRYTRDEREAQYINPRTQSLLTGSDVCSLAASLQTNGTCFNRATVSFNQPTYTVSLDWKPTEDTLFYIAHRLGYRSGGLQARVILTAGGAAPPFAPEKVRDVEAGFHGMFRLGGGISLSVEAAFFHNWYDGYQHQTTALTGLPAPLTTTVIVNAGSAQSTGWELNAALNVRHDFQLSGYWGHVVGTFENFPGVNAGVTTLFKVPFLAPVSTLGATAAFTPIDDDSGKVTWLTEVSYRAHSFGDNSLPIVEPESRIPPQWNINMSVEWANIHRSGITAQLWIRNLADERHVLGVSALSSSFGVTPGVLGDPRTFGATLRYNFGH